jgi:hypothetical protein
MQEFEPSRNFIAKVMEDVRAYEASRNVDVSWSRMFLSTRSARYALSAAGGLLGIINLVRIYLTLFSPVVCR